MILGYNSTLPQGDKGRRRSKFVLYKRSKAELAVNLLFKKKEIIYLTKNRMVFDYFDPSFIQNLSQESFFFYLSLALFIVNWSLFKLYLLIYNFRRSKTLETKSIYC